MDAKRPWGCGPGQDPAGEGNGPSLPLDEGVAPATPKPEPPLAGPPVPDRPDAEPHVRTGQVPGDPDPAAGLVFLGLGPNGEPWSWQPLPGQPLLVAGAGAAGTPWLARAGPVPRRAAGEPLVWAGWGPAAREIRFPHPGAGVTGDAPTVPWVVLTRWARGSDPGDVDVWIDPGGSPAGGGRVRPLWGERVLMAVPCSDPRGRAVFVPWFRAGPAQGMAGIAGEWRVLWFRQRWRDEPVVPRPAGRSNPGPASRPSLPGAGSKGTGFMAAGAGPVGLVGVRDLLPGPTIPAAHASTGAARASAGVRSGPLPRPASAGWCGGASPVVLLVLPRGRWPAPAGATSGPCGDWRDARETAPQPGPAVRKGGQPESAPPARPGGPGLWLGIWRRHGDGYWLAEWVDLDLSSLCPPTGRPASPGAGPATGLPARRHPTAWVMVRLLVAPDGGAALVLAGRGGTGPGRVRLLARITPEGDLHRKTCGRQPDEPAPAEAEVGQVPEPPRPVQAGTTVDIGWLVDLGVTTPLAETSQGTPPAEVEEPRMQPLPAAGLSEEPAPEPVQGDPGPPGTVPAVGHVARPGRGPFPHGSRP